MRRFCGATRRRLSAPGVDDHSIGATCDTGRVSEQPGRYQRSASGMVGALVILLLAIGAFVAFRALNREELEVRPTEVDYLTAVEAAQSERRRVVYPDALPQGWTATSIDARGEDWGIGFLTPDDFAGVQQSARPVDELLATYVDEETVRLPAVEPGGQLGRSWRAYEDGEGDLAFAATFAEETVLVYGSASREDLLRLAASLTTAPVDS